MFEEVENKDNEMDLENVDIKREQVNTGEIRKVKVPYHRMNPLKKNWDTIVKLIAEKMKLLIRMNVRHRVIELKPSEVCEDNLNLNRATDFLKAFMLGFELNDAVSLLRMDDLYIESFEIKDVKRLHGQHLSRAIARITGEKGKTKNSIENSTKTRIIVASSKIHILGSYGNIKLAR